MLGILLAATLLGSPASPVVCIDPGHPSEVGVGTRGKKLTELNVAWTVAKGLEERLEAGGYQVVLTKEQVGEKVLNRRRAEIANKSRARLMVRLHCDAAAGSGFAVYFPSQAGRNGDKTGPSKNIVEASRKAAKSFHSAMANALAGKLTDNGLKTDLATAVGARQGALTGSIYSEVPVLLVEMVVLTNAKDEAFIASSSGQRAMVEALAAGVRAAVRQ